MTVPSEIFPGLELNTMLCNPPYSECTTVKNSFRELQFIRLLHVHYIKYNSCKRKLVLLREAGGGGLRTT
jgi:hypothetical protein